MALLTTAESQVFDTNQIARGYLIYAKHTSWQNGRTGIVSKATGDMLVVQYYPDIGNVTNHFFILASEVAAGDWEIRWSENLTVVNSFVEEA